MNDDDDGFFFDDAESDEIRTMAKRIIYVGAVVAVVLLGVVAWALIQLVTWVVSQ